MIRPPPTPPLSPTPPPFRSAPAAGLPDRGLPEPRRPFLVAVLRERWLFLRDVDPGRRARREREVGHAKRAARPDRLGPDRRPLVPGPPLARGLQRPPHDEDRGAPGEEPRRQYPGTLPGAGGDREGQGRHLRGDAGPPARWAGVPGPPSLEPPGLPRRVPGPRPLSGPAAATRRRRPRPRD